MNAQRLGTSDSSPPKHSRSFGDILPSERQVGIRGKTVVFVIESRDQRSNSVILPGFFQIVGAGEKSGMVSYEDLFAGKKVTADVLILRFSRLHEYHPGQVAKALEGFRSANPKSAVILCTLVTDMKKTLGDLVDVIHGTTLVDDAQLMRQGAAIADGK
jgi:hypothetical protein